MCQQTRCIQMYVCLHNTPCGKSPLNRLASEQSCTIESRNNERQHSILAVATACRTHAALGQPHSSGGLHRSIAPISNVLQEQPSCVVISRSYSVTTGHCPRLVHDPRQSLCLELHVLRKCCQCSHLSCWCCWC